MSDQLWFQKDGVDLVEGIELVDGKAMPGGFSVYTVQHNGARVCTLYWGFPRDFEAGYAHRVEKAAA